MKLVAIITLLIPCATLFGCEKYPLKSLREMYDGLKGLEEMMQLEGARMFMFNHAIAHNDIEALKILYTKGKSRKVIEYEDIIISQAERRGAEPIFFRPLHIAAQFGALDIMDFCLEQGANPNTLTHSEIEGFDKNTPAHVAVMCGQYEALKKLLGCYINLEARNGLKQTIEEIAQAKGDTKAVELITAAREKKFAAFNEEIQRLQNLEPYLP